MAQDYYQTLGISKNASADEIKRAYRKLAHQYHPDKDRGDEVKFKEVNQAYQVLSDPKKRQQYDQFGATFDQRGFSGGGPGFSGDFSDFMRGFGVDFGEFSSGGGSAFGGDDAFDIFSNIFGTTSGRRSRGNRGVDLEMEFGLTFEEAVFGIEKEVSLEKKDKCERCNGSGAEVGAKITACRKCHGTGQIKNIRRTIFGSFSSVTICDECDGEGKIPEIVCKECKGLGVHKRYKTLKVKIPPGVDNGSRIRIPNEGEAGYRGSSFGDLYLHLRVSSHPFFKREENNILSEVPVSFYQAALGATVETQTVEGKVKLKIPAGTQSGKIFRLKNKGVPFLGHSGRGDHLITVRVITPSKLTKKEKELFKEMAKEKGESVDSPTGGEGGFWGKFTG